MASTSTATRASDPRAVSGAGGTDASATQAGADRITRTSGDTRLALYRQVVRLRWFEERAFRLFMDGLVAGTSHLSIGMEAVAAGFAEAMRHDDYTFCTYRGHAHTLARGTPMAGVMGELLGRRTGVCGGKGGSMHLTSVEHGVMGSYAIIGAHLPIANGAAWSALERDSGQVAVCFFGDGTTNIGAFHEALNLAEVWRLPVVFVCENNLYMEYTPIGDVTAVEHPAADRAGAYGMESIIVDGNDPDAVHEVAIRVIERARAGEGPSLVEAKTYRHGGHSRADPGTYRPDDEVAEWLARDPVPTYRQRLLDAGIGEELLVEIEQAADADIDAATEDAKAAEPPEVRAAYADVWADGGASWRR